MVNLGTILDTFAHTEATSNKVGTTKKQHKADVIKCSSEKTR